MEITTLEEAEKGILAQLESTLGKLAVAADSYTNTSSLEDKAKKLVGRIKASTEIFNNLAIYTKVKGSRVYDWSVTDTLPDNIFTKYASLCKTCKEQLEVYQEEENYFAKVTDTLFIKVSDLPESILPTFAVKIEGNTLLAVRTDLFAKLPSGIKDLMRGNSSVP